ncbi:HepT-like ribonuclease domain-containing protein [Desulfovirgula thermocuniculi]|uniref:HepT-like ribonuclease domain-containing protein n=1 Tax=Desulfovirgula thermocuniculi TaxID=348842 RepID=UPI00316ABF74
MRQIGIYWIQKRVEELNLLAERLIRMARFRNLLIHQYGDIDDRKVYEIICSSLNDLDLYLTELATLLKAL